MSATAPGARSARTTAPTGTAWEYFPHDHARSRAYRWNEDGLAGISDRHQEVCLALALWNGRDPILKERLFGLTGNEGNHGEDVKEYYFYLDSTPTHSYMRMLYKYPQAAFPYNALVEENRRRGRGAPEFELVDTGVFNDDRYFDVVVEYAKVDSRRPRDARHGDQSWSRGRADSRVAHRVVPQHLGLGPPRRAGEPWPGHCSEGRGRVALADAPLRPARRVVRGAAW